MFRMIYLLIVLTSREMDVINSSRYKIRTYSTTEASTRWQ